jgi:hypothetical protein
MPKRSTPLRFTTLLKNTIAPLLIGELHLKKAKGCTGVVQNRHNPQTKQKSG